MSTVINLLTAVITKLKMYCSRTKLLLGMRTVYLAIKKEVHVFLNSQKIDILPVSETHFTDRTYIR